MMEILSLRNFDTSTYNYFPDLRLQTTIKDSLKCPKCGKILVDPLQLVSCGHRICKPCFEDLALEPGSKAKFCPIDSERIEFSFTDQGALREIVNLIVHCTFEKQGCKWCGKIIEFLTHLKICKFAANWIICDFSIIGCAKKGHREEMEMHYRKATVMHFQYLAKKILKFSAIMDHACSMMESISLTSRECGENLKEDSDSTLAVYSAIDGLHERITSTDSQVKTLSNKLSNMQEVSNLIGQDITSFSMLSDISTLRGKFQSLETRVTNAEQEVEGKVVNPVTIISNRSHSTPHDQRLRAIEKERKTRRENLSDIDLKIRLFQATTTNGRYVWKIDNYPRRMREAKEEKIIELYSPPLYSDVFGYKVCCKIFLNGKPGEKGYGDSVAFFMIIMKSDFDELLQFPFPRIFRVTLLARDSSYDIEKTIEPNDSEPFHMPRQDMNPIVGHNFFVSHEDLATNRYLWDDALFFKIDFTQKSSNFS